MSDDSRVEIERIRAADRAAAREARAQQLRERAERQAEARAERQEQLNERRKQQEERRDDARYGSGALGEASQFLNEKVYQPVTSLNRGNAQMSRSRAIGNIADTRMHNTGARLNQSEVRYVNSSDALADFYAQRAGQNQQGGDYAPTGYSSVAGSQPGTANSTYQYGNSNGYAPPQGAASQGAQQQGTNQGLVLATSISDPLERAMNTTGAERDAALDQVLAAVNRIGPNTNLPRPPQGRTYKITYDTARDFVAEFDPRKPLTPAILLDSSLALYEKNGGSPDLANALRARANGQAAPAPTQHPTPQQTEPQAPALQTPARQPSASQTPVAQTSATAPMSIDIPKASGGAAEYHGHKKGELRIPMAKNQVDTIQELLIANKLPVGSKDGKPDGKNGDVTQGSLKFLCNEFGIDPRKVNLAATNLSPETQSLLDKAKARAGALAASQQTALQGPTAEELAAAEAARAAQTKAQADAREIPALLNTPFDSRNIAGMNEGQRYALARETLLGIGELKYEKKQHNFENLHDKLKEAVRDANKIMGENIFREPRDQKHPFTDDAMAALGVVAAKEAREDARQGHLNPMAAALAQAQQQGALNSSVSGGVDLADASASSTRGATGPQVKGR